MATDSSFCQQRRLIQMFNVPLARFTPANPYTSTQFTKMQLDMRRKVEVLKYSSNRSSTQTNNLTKRERFALLVRGGIPSPSQEILQSNTNACVGDELIPTSTTSSDVPGPPMFLFEDPTVPLYNYSDFNTRSYPDFVPTDLERWQFVMNPDTLVYDNETNIIYYLIINERINKPLYTYNIVTPVGLTVTGSIPPGYVKPSGFDGNVSLKINSASLIIYYNNSLVKTVVPVSLSNFAIIINIPTSNTGSLPLSFRFTQFLGNLAFNNVQLYTVPSYVYTFSLSVDIAIVQNNTGVFNNIALIANMSKSTINSVSGCSIVSLGQSSVNAGSSIFGQ